MTIISNKVINISVGTDIFSRKMILHVMTIIIIMIMMNILRLLRHDVRSSFEHF